MNQLDKDVNQLIANSKAKKNEPLKKRFNQRINSPCKRLSEKDCPIKIHLRKLMITSSIVISISVATIIRSKSVRLFGTF